ncbi:glycosyl hydrolase family 16 [Dyadobacter jejuensis]|uniref:Glycosyl hydrolase family 16 n=1 Tax=Dyadobacter jejuensis TaxID=1082580 RepID=A0A316ANL0_9BACT|nr:glycoside hydrolase family 16 protein [Dyadobacter jejuensis]PWJ59323.1 glycosyl hydrolase family 16 [Dyadobacter jejuensis]
MKNIVAFLGLLCLSFIAKGQAEIKSKKLIWSDEFDREGLPDSTKWTFETKGNAYGWGNNEKQFYTPAEAGNAVVKGGFLQIVAKKEPSAEHPYTSARLSTSNKFSFTYGRVEVRAKLPEGRGTWPAIWMLGQDIGHTKWPDCGEIDIMEHVGYDPGVLHGTVHTKAYNHVLGTQKGKTTSIVQPFDTFHVYAIDWTPDKIDFLLDGAVYHTFENDHRTTAEWPFDAPEFLLLNVAVGGNWGGKMGIDDLVFPATMWVDYVRVYQGE